MSVFWHSYKAEFFKNKHSVFLWAHILMPFLLVAIMTFSRFGKLSSLGLFVIFFKMIGFAFPLLAAALCGLIASQEKPAGDYQMMIGRLPHKTTTFISQLCMLLTMCLGAIFLAILLFMISMKWILHVTNINYLLFFKTGGLIFLSVIFLYSLYLILAYHFNTGVCTMVGFSGVIIVALASTSQGDSIWMFLPWVWSVRFIDFIAALRFNDLSKIPLKYISYPQGGMDIGLMCMGVMTIFCVAVYIFTFHLWEGRQK
ncbi:lantibiotic immunity ABC transporter MutG family permease subunit [Clostridium estertheticum]|uniref:lantibiotic immunity ABC transporter MutG family permease subunit n=1 Tax=Clostridium estertheticum TaxID=238834 RepID=UPI001C0BD140|nr:lantibiotic immunity ABC transporter MutG family permease subunit [Clostridium estertheticum]MBU3178581.1 lantibiotic immunity ABC transporter MutG family permease subunit [Clostridium estertheticum]